MAYRSPMNPKSHHLGCLDGIRALAAMWVLLGHVALVAGWRCTDPRVAVDIFMILSGYLMLFQSVVHRADEDMGRFSRGFFLRRFFRIAPLYYVLLIFCYLTQGSYAAWTKELSAHPGFYETAQRSAFSAGHALTHFSFLYGLSPRFSVSTLMPDWSLTLEMQFYAVFPLLLLWFKRQSFLLPVLGLLAVSLISIPLLTSRFPFPTVLPMKLPLFLAGILLAWARWKTTSGTVRIICLALVMAILGQKDRMLAVMAATVLLCDFGQARVPGLSFCRDSVMRFLGCKPLRRLADWSYGLYLIHPLILIPSMLWLSHHDAWNEQPVMIRFLSLGMPVFVVSVLLASVLRPAIEIPGIQFGRWLEKKMRASRQPEAPSENSSIEAGSGYLPGLVTLSPE